MKTFSIAILALVASSSAKHLRPRRLDTTLGMFAEEEPSTYEQRHSNDFVKPYHGGDMATMLGTQGYAASEAAGGDLDLMGGQREFGPNIVDRTPKKKQVISGLTGEAFDHSYLGHKSEINLGVRFVDQNDIKFNSEVSGFIGVDKIGSKGYLVAGTDDPAKFSGGFKKEIPDIEEMRGFLKQFSTEGAMPAGGAGDDPMSDGEKRDPEIADDEASAPATPAEE